MSLYLRHRPQSLDEIISNLTTVEALEAKLSSKKDIPHAMLFTGPSGCGKTTLARIVARELGCAELDLREVDSAHYGGVDMIRSLRQQMQLKALSGERRVWILDEVHQLSKDAQNALLKALEDTPEHVYFLLCTTDPQRLLPTILTRCMSFPVHPLAGRHMRKLLDGVCRKEGIGLDDEALELICRESQGSPRTALNMLDKVRGLDATRIKSAVEECARRENSTVDLVKLLLVSKPRWLDVAKRLQELEEEDPERIRRGIMGYCAALLKGKNHSARVWMLMDALRAPLYDNGHTGLVMALYEYTTTAAGGQI